MSHINIKLLDQDKNILKENNYPFRSFTKNFIRGIMYAIAGGVPSFPDFTHEDGANIYNDYITRTFNPGVGVETAGSPSPFYIQSCGIRVANRNSTDLDVDPETIEGLIENGYISGTLHHSYMDLHNNGNNLISLNRPFINLSGASIVINSTALMTYCNVGNIAPIWKQLPVAVDILDDEITIENHQLLDVTYCIDVTVADTLLYPSLNFAELIRLAFGQQTNTDVVSPLPYGWFEHWVTGTQRTVTGKVENGSSKLQVNRDVSEGEDGGILLGTGRTTSIDVLASVFAGTYSDTTFAPTSIASPNVEISNASYDSENILGFKINIDAMSVSINVSGFSGLSNIEYMDIEGNWNSISPAGDIWIATESFVKIRATSHDWDCEEGDGRILFDKTGDSHLTLSSNPSDLWSTDTDIQGVNTLVGYTTQSVLDYDLSSKLTATAIWANISTYSLAFKINFSKFADTDFNTIFYCSSDNDYSIQIKATSFRIEQFGYYRTWTFSSIDDGKEHDFIVRGTSGSNCYAYLDGVALGVGGTGTLPIKIDRIASSFSIVYSLIDFRIWSVDVGDAECLKYHLDTMTIAADILILTNFITGVAELGNSASPSNIVKTYVPAADSSYDIFGNSLEYDIMTKLLYKRVANYSIINSLTNDFDQSIEISEGGLFGAGGVAVQADDSTLPGGPISLFKFQFDSGVSITLGPGEKLYNKVFIGTEIEDYKILTEGSS